MKLLVTILSFLVILTGCASRKITIYSEPEGAKVIVDSQEIGITPCTFPFTYYGTRQIILEKEGYQTERVLVPINPPLIHIFPFDILILFMPYPMVDLHHFSYTLSPSQESNLNEILKRGEELKEYLNRKVK